MAIATSVEQIYADLDKIDQVDSVTGAIYRERAQDVLATPTIALQLRKAIAERLSQMNQLLMLKTVDGEDSY
ncbi:conserved hypothetical protein [Gloeothece citriformis PCC 7424]|uniref:Uncharacterized protein n=1 Tax=Gloeothece citriformis (strain PCC 7424) TaxID=65393 RepID=B7KB10_GLOC7|nr:hypothetical protein [Gloeothece citriformis]ACK70120.1 conserved hypothetical protein [Gloeothece citriformis PCC 7424]